MTDCFLLLCVLVLSLFLSGFAQFVPGLSATPVGALLQGGSTVINLMGSALGGIAGVSATAQDPNAAATVTRAAASSGRIAAARSASARPSVPVRGPSASSPPCDFDSASACLNSCVDPAVVGGVHSDCVEACWNYPCSVSASPDSALRTDPKAMIRGLKLYSLFQTLARRTPVIDNAQASILSLFGKSAQEQPTQSAAGGRKLLQFAGPSPFPAGPGGAGLGGAPPIGLGGQAAPSSSASAALGASFVSGFQSILNAFGGGASTTPVAGSGSGGSTTQPPASSTAQPSSSSQFNTAASGPPSSPFASSPFTSSVPNPFASSFGGGASSIPPSPFGSAGGAAPAMPQSTSATLINAFSNVLSSFAAPNAAVVGGTGAAANPFATASATSNAPAGVTGATNALAALGQASQVSQTQRNGGEVR